ERWLSGQRVVAVTGGQAEVLAIGADLNLAAAPGADGGARLLEENTVAFDGKAVDAPAVLPEQIAASRGHDRRAQANVLDAEQLARRFGRHLAAFEPRGNWNPARPNNHASLR